ncbi:hypothetical protein CDD81_5651 [Ophiocordyceps australis]|uniref:Uncharacterized protein n=1 Tax=Ophiocordyceps australis TaxID=1399860 RepID=A0A2C5Y8A1_9HYPO|nr:hypothetical protein CDD81_5651 [Ophiocordyceps australis]
MANLDPSSAQDLFAAQEHDPVIKLERDPQAQTPCYDSSPALFPDTPQLPSLEFSLAQSPPRYPSAAAIMANDIEALGSRITATEALFHGEIQDLGQQLKAMNDRIRLLERRLAVLHNEMCKSVNPFAIRTGVLPITPLRSFTTGRLLPNFPNTYTRFWDLGGEEMSAMLEQLDIFVQPNSSLRIQRMKLMLVSGVPPEFVNRDV